MFFKWNTDINGSVDICFFPEIISCKVAFHFLVEDSYFFSGRAWFLGDRVSLGGHLLWWFRGNWPTLGETLMVGGFLRVVNDFAGCPLMGQLLWWFRGKCPTLGETLMVGGFLRVVNDLAVNEQRKVLVPLKLKQILEWCNSRKNLGKDVCVSSKTC